MCAKKVWLGAVSGWEDCVWAYQSCWNWGSVGRVFGLRWWEVRTGCGVWTMVWKGGVMSVWVVRPDSLCRWQVQVSVCCTRWIPAHLRCTQCSMMLHLMDIYFLPCSCLWQISQIQTRLCVVVGPVFVSTSPALMRSSAKTVNRAPIAGGVRFRHTCTAVCIRFDSSTACRLCHLE